MQQRNAFSQESLLLHFISIVKKGQSRFFYQLYSNWRVCLFNIRGQIIYESTSFVYKFDDLYAPVIPNVMAQPSTSNQDAGEKQY